MSAPVPEDGVDLAPGDDQFRRPENTHLTLYLAAFVLFVGLAVWGLAAFNEDKSSARADALATELALRFAAARLGPIDIDATARVLGADGGVACTDPVSTLRRGVLDRQIVSGAAGPGMRPVVADRRMLIGHRLAIEVYCPEYLADFDAEVNELRLGDGE